MPAGFQREPVSSRARPAIVRRRSPGAAMPGTSPLMSATNTGTPAAESCSAMQLQRLGLAGAGRAGDEAVPVHHRERNADQRLGMDLPVMDGRPERHRRRGARARKRGPDGREHLGVEGHVRTLATGAAGATIGAIDDAVG